MTQKLPCTRCGELIHPDTADRNGGLCMPCKGGYRDRIEEGKRWREREREYRKSPEAVYWKSLATRALSADPAAVSKQERLYFAVGCLIGEVFNGGFDQFFSNSSGALYSDAVEGLQQMHAAGSLRLLENAKELIFGNAAVPLSQEERMVETRRVPPESALSKQLDALDREFWSDPDKLAKRSEEYAKQHGLYGAV